MQRLRFILFVLPLFAAVGLPAGAAAYAWPLEPFDRQHEVRAVFGEPRTAFDLSPGAEGLNGPGRFGFSDGIDIAAVPGTEVYPVASGRVSIREADSVRVTRADGTAFDYRNIAPLVGDGTIAAAGETLLGAVPAEGDSLHFAELDDGRPVNPLQRGHLQPYVDRTRPVVRRLLVRDADGSRVGPLGLCERVSLLAEAFDVPAIRGRGPWSGMRNAPAHLRWELIQLSTGKVLEERTRANFLETLPPSERFWEIFARGTHENMPRFAGQRLVGMPARYLFSLTPDGLNTLRLANGAYAVNVAAADVRGKKGVLTRRFTVFNARYETGERGCPGGP